MYNYTLCFNIPEVVVVDWAPNPPNEVPKPVPKPVAAGVVLNPPNPDALLVGLAGWPNENPVDADVAGAVLKPKLGALVAGAPKALI